MSDIPIYRSAAFAALPPDDPRRWASMRRAADCWWAEGQPAVIRSRLLDEFEVADLLARWRVRAAGDDVRGDTDWPRVQAIVIARAAGYVPPERTPRPWTAEQLGMSTWREVSS